MEAPSLPEEDPASEADPQQPAGGVETPATPDAVAPESISSAPDTGSGQAASEVDAPAPTDEIALEAETIASGPPPCKAPRRWLVALIGLVALVVLAGVGFFGLRAYAGRAVLYGQASLIAGDLDGARVRLEQAGRFSALLPRGERGRLSALLGEIAFRQARPEDAEALVAAALRLDPSLGAAHSTLAGVRFARGDLPGALEEAARAQALDDGLGLPYALQAYQHSLEGKADQARQAADAALARDDGLALAYRVRGTLAAWQLDLAAAQVDLARAAAIDADDVETLGWQAFVAYEMRDRQALSAAAAKASSAPVSPATLWIGALASTYQEDCPAALEGVGRAIQMDGKRAELYLLRAACTELTAGQVDALADLDRALELRPDFAPAAIARAVRLYARYELEGAEEEAARLEELAPGSPAGLELTVLYRLRRGERDAALEASERAIAILPQHPEGYFLRGMARLGRYELSQAAGDFQKALELDPDYLPAVLGQAQVAAEQHDFPTALKADARALELDPRSTVVLTQRAGIYVLQEENDQARADLDAALQIDPEDPGALGLMAAIEAGAGNSARGLELANRAIKSIPKSPLPYLARAQVYVGRKNFNAARKDALKASELDLSLPAPYIALARIDLLQENWNSATYNAGKALELAPWLGQAYTLRGQAYLKLERVDEAIADLNKAIVMLPEPGETYLTLARAHEQKGDYAAAARSLEALLASTQDVSLIGQAEGDLGFYRSVPPAISGRRTLVDGKNGFSIVYTQDWVPARIPADETHAILALDWGERAIYLQIYAWKPGELPPGVTPQRIFNIVEAGLKENPTYQRLSLTPYQSGAISGLVVVFNVWREVTEDFSMPVTIRTYYLVAGDQVVMIEFGSLLGPGSEIYDTASQNVEDMVATFRFIPPS